MISRFEVDFNDVDVRGYIRVRGIDVAPGTLVKLVDPDDGTEIFGRLEEMLEGGNTGLVNPHPVLVVAYNIRMSENRFGVASIDAEQYAVGVN